MKAKRNGTKASGLTTTFGNSYIRHTQRVRPSASNAVDAAPALALKALLAGRRRKAV